MPANQGALTTIGLNNAGSTVVSAARAVGFDAGTGAEIFSLGFVHLNCENVHH